MMNPKNFFKENKLQATKDIAAYFKNHKFVVETFEDGIDDFILITNSSNDNAMIRVNPLKLMDCRSTGSFKEMSWELFVSRNI